VGGFARSLGVVPLRAAIGGVVIAITLVAWWFFGLSITSGTIAVITFIGAVIGWVAVDNGRGSGGSHDKVTEDVVSGGSARLTQKGGSLAARRIVARRDVEIRQENEFGS
jgi:hypothetical protein